MASFIALALFNNATEMKMIDMRIGRFWGYFFAAIFAACAAIPIFDKVVIS